MRRGLLACALLLICQSVTASPADDQQAIRDQLAAQVSAWNKGDISDFMRTYENSTETTFIGAQVRKGYEPILQRYRQAYADQAQMGTLTFSEIEVRLLPSACGGPEYAVVTGRFHLDRTQKGEAKKDDGIFSLVWHKGPRGWKILLDHTS